MRNGRRVPRFWRKWCFHLQANNYVTQLKMETGTLLQPPTTLCCYNTEITKQWELESTSRWSVCTAYVLEFWIENHDASSKYSQSQVIMWQHSISWGDHKLCNRTGASKKIETTGNGWMSVFEKKNHFKQSTAAGVAGPCNDVELSPRDTSHCIMPVSKWPTLSRTPWTPHAGSCWTIPHTTWTCHHETIMCLAP
jgi:hypothetical protein